MCRRHRNTPICRALVYPALASAAKREARHEHWRTVASKYRFQCNASLEIRVTCTFQISTLIQRLHVLYLEHGNRVVGQATEKTIFATVVVVVIEESDAEHPTPVDGRTAFLRTAAKLVTVMNNGDDAKRMQVSGHSVKRRL